MKYKELLKKLIEYEKRLNGRAFGLQVLLFSVIVALFTNYGINKRDSSLSSKNMSYLIDTYLEDGILVLPLYDDEISEGLIATGEVLVTYLKEYNINATIVGNRIIIIAENKDLEKLELDDINLEEVRKVLTYEEVAKKYNLESSNNYWFDSFEENKIVLELKK